MAAAEESLASLSENSNAAPAPAAGASLVVPEGLQLAIELGEALGERRVEEDPELSPLVGVLAGALALGVEDVLELVQQFLRAANTERWNQHCPVVSQGSLDDIPEALAASDGDYATELALIEAHMERLLAEAGPADPAILALHTALFDPDMLTVADIAAQLGVTVRSVERLSRRAFGFPPKLLLRRQRFLRSLARFMLDPSRKWLGSLDCHYHDQSHFVRDFRRFMGMCPTEYARAEKPLLAAAARARMAAAGAAMQGLHAPGGEPAPVPAA